MQHPCARFTDGSVAHHVLGMTSTSALSLLSVFLVDILTLTYVSQLHYPLWIAAVGLGKTLGLLNGAMVSGVVIAATAVLSERVGRQGGKRQERLVLHMLLMAVMVAAAVAGLEFLCLAPLNRWLSVDLSGSEGARLFIGLSLIATMPGAMLQMCVQLLRAQGYGREALMALLAGAVILALTDPLFIFVLKGGVIGAGLSNLLSACVGAGVGLLFLQRHLGIARRPAIRVLGLHIRPVARIALPAVLGNLAMPVGLVYLTATLAGLGVSALAGMAVVDRVLQLGYCAFFALPGALVPILAQNLGAGRLDRARQAAIFTAKLVLLYGGVLWFALAMAGPAIADFFELADMGRSMFLAFSGFGAGLWIIFGLDFVAQSLFLTLGRAWWVPAFGWLRGTLGSIPFVYTGAHWHGGTGALVGMWSGNALVALLAIATAVSAAQRYSRQRSYFSLRSRSAQ